MTDEVAISYFIRHGSMHLQKVYLEKKVAVIFKPCTIFSQYLKTKLLY